MDLIIDLDRAPEIQTSKSPISINACVIHGLRYTIDPPVPMWLIQPPDKPMAVEWIFQGVYYAISTDFRWNGEEGLKFNMAIEKAYQEARVTLALLVEKAIKHEIQLKVDE